MFYLKKNHHYFKSCFFAFKSLVPSVPNGIQLEFTCRALDHDKIMAEDASKAHQEIDDWTERTKALKVEKFGEKSLVKK